MTSPIACAGMAKSPKGFQESAGVLRGDRKQQSPRRLRIEQEVPDLLRHAARELDAVAEKSLFRFRPPGRKPSRVFDSFRQKIDLEESITRLTLLPTAISRAWPSRPKPVMSVAACTSNGGQSRSRRGSACTWIRCGVHRGLAGLSFLERRADDPGAQAFGQNQPVARLRGAFFSTRCGLMRPVTA